VWRSTHPARWYPQKLGFDSLRLRCHGRGPVPVAVLEFMGAIGVPLYEGYGMSETGGSVSVNRPGAIGSAPWVRCFRV